MVIGYYYVNQPNFLKQKKTNEKIRLFYHDLPHLMVKNCNTDIDCLILKKSHLILKILKLINHGHFVIFLLGQYARYDI